MTEALPDSPRIQQLLPEEDRCERQVLYRSTEQIDVKLSPEDAKQPANILLLHSYLLVWNETLAERIDLSNFSQIVHHPGECMLPH